MSRAKASDEAPQARFDRALFGWNKAHLVGIGGAGMSAIARVLRQAGVEVTGSDLKETAVLSGLRELGIQIHVGHRGEYALGADIVVVSAAVADENPELLSARAAGIEVMNRGAALARLVEGNRVVAVSGTHGKTTTSGMVATILEAAGMDPTYLIGADLSNRGPGARLGGGGVAVVEADEAYGSFLALSPSIAVVTNIDDDHLDHYGSRQALHDAFVRFTESAEDVIVCFEDAEATRLLAGAATMFYGFPAEEDGSSEEGVCGVGFETRAGGSNFQLLVDGSPKGMVELKVAGRHNALNALGAIAACLSLGLPVDQILAGLAEFQGVLRRFEFKGSLLGADVFDDYAHHPAEIEATLAAARDGPWRRVVVVFQPHLYSRTSALWQDFGKSLSGADVVVVTDVYGAREQPVAGVTGKLIVEAACELAPRTRIGYFPKLDEAASFLRRVLREGDVLLTLGAGDVTTMHDRLQGRAH